MNHISASEIVFLATRNDWFCETGTLVPGDHFAPAANPWPGTFSSMDVMNEAVFQRINPAGQAQAMAMPRAPESVVPLPFPQGPFSPAQFLAQRNLSCSQWQGMSLANRSQVVAIYYQNAFPGPPPSSAPTPVYVGVIPSPNPPGGRSATATSLTTAQWLLAGAFGSQNWPFAPIVLTGTCALWQSFTLAQKRDWVGNGSPNPSWSHPPAPAQFAGWTSDQLIAFIDDGCNSRQGVLAPWSPPYTVADTQHAIMAVDAYCAAQNPAVQHAPSMPTAPHVSTSTPHAIMPHYMVKPAGQAIGTSAPFLSLSNPITTGLLGLAIGIGVGYFAGRR